MQRRIPGTKRLGYGTTFDYWEIPGGKSDPNEDPISTAIREAKEETNLDLSNCEIIYKDVEKTDVGVWDFFVVLAKQYKGEPSLTEPNKYSEFKWISINDVPKNIYPPSLRAINEYKEWLDKNT